MRMDEKINSVLRTAVVGYGYWGPHMARNISQISGFELSAVIDFSADRQAIASERHPGTPVFSTIDEAIQSIELDALVVATPTHTHFELAKKAIVNGLHVIVEKPLTTDVPSSMELANLAITNGCVLMVDHTYVYSTAVEQIKSLVDSGDLGELVYFDSTRVNLGLFQPDVSVLWDLAVHDLAILQRVTGRMPTAVSANGGQHRNAKYEAAAFLTLYFDDLFFAHINVSWLSPMKIRRTVLSGTKKTVLFDDMLPDERIRIYDAGVEQNESTLLQYRLGNILVPKLANSEALRTELEHFRECIKSGSQTISSASSAVEIIATLEAAQKSMESGGLLVQIDYPVC